MKKLLLISIVLLSISPILSAQNSENVAINAYKKLKCLSQMTNCDNRQSYYLGTASYWQCYLDNNLSDSPCRQLYPSGNLPECPEDDINFPTEASTKYFMDKCVANTQVYISRKTAPAIVQTPTYNSLPPRIESAPVQDDSRIMDVSGIYFISNESYINGNFARRIQLEEDRINDKDSQITILSNGAETLSTRRRNNDTEISGTWDYIHQSDDQQLDQLRFKRSCTVKFNGDGTGFSITMREIKFRPVGGLAMGLLNVWDQANKGLDANTAANNLKWEIALDKGTIIYEYIRKK